MTSNRHAVAREPSKKKVVFVEGKDEVNVFESILHAIGITDIEVFDVGGKDKLAANFKSAIQSPGFIKVRSFGIAQDADNDPAAALDRIKGVLTDNKFIAPIRSGMVTESGERKVGILVLPSGERQGYLEDLFLDSHKETDLSECVEIFATSSEATGCTPFDSKRRTHAFLAALDAPEPRLGLAFAAGKVNGNHASFDVIREFLKIL